MYSSDNIERHAIVIIGAGIGGLSAAIYLAAAGYDVRIFEQNDHVGGKMGQICADGFRWDTGPSVITMRHVFEELFASAGRRLDDYLTLEPVEPLTRYFYPDGITLDASRDLPRMTEQIGAINERDVEGYLSYLSYAARLHRITGPVFIYDKPPSWRSFLKVSPLDTLRIDPWRTMNAAIEAHVESPHMRQLLGRFATYVGASPYRAPATLNVIAHVELTGGVWYPRGGVYEMARALERLARELGVEIHTSTPVQAIDVTAGTVRGIVLADDTVIPAEAVIANVDVATVYERLLPIGAGGPNRIDQLTDLEPSCSGFILLLGVEGKYPDLAHHNIFFSSDYRREFAQIFDYGVPPDEPTVYVAITSKRDSEHAPAGCENWFVLVNAPPVGPNFDWEQDAGPYRDLVLGRLAGYGYDVRDRIRVQRMLTPHDVQRLSGARRGALYGISSNSMWTAFRRPHNRAPDIRGLYVAGGTTHPGGGVPMVTLSGKVAAQMVMDDM